MRRLLALAGLGAAAAALVGYARGRMSILRHVDDYRTHWARRVDGGDGVLHYVALGDSAAQGVGASAVEHGYVALLAERLAGVTGREVVTTNLSVSGATSADVVRDQLPLLAELPFVPDVVTLDIGGNDVVFPGHTPSTFEAHLGQILEALPEGSYVADVPWFALPVLGRQSRQMAARAAVLVDRHGHHLVPLHAVTRSTGPLGYHRYTAGDRFHPNDRGHRGWADTFWAEMEGSGLLDRLTAATGVDADRRAGLGTADPKR